VVVHSERFIFEFVIFNLFGVRNFQNFAPLQGGVYIRRIITIWRCYSILDFHSPFRMIIRNWTHSILVVQHSAARWGFERRKGHEEEEMSNALQKRRASM